VAIKAYDSNPLRQHLQERGMELVCPYKTNRFRPAMQDGRAPRRYRRRWIVERTIGWLGTFQRLVTKPKERPVKLGLLAASRIARRVLPSIRSTQEIDVVAVAAARPGPELAN
jgi:transposase